MPQAISNHLRHNAVAYLALFFALSGSAYALSKGEVRSKHIAAKAVKQKHVANGAITAAKVNGQIPGPPTGSAGGALAGSYPNPQLAEPAPWSFVDDEDMSADAPCGFASAEARPVGYHRDALGRVQLRGSAVLSCPGVASGPIVFGLPPGYRPDGFRSFPAFKNLGAPTVVEISASGSVRVIDTLAPGDAVRLDAVSFRADG